MERNERKTGEGERGREKDQLNRDRDDVRQT